MFPESRYLFEGHLTVEPEPAPPAWLVAQNLLTSLAVAQDWASVSESSSQGQEENANTTESSRVTQLPDSVRELINNMQEIGGFLDLDNAIEASLRVRKYLFGSYVYACSLIRSGKDAHSKELPFCIGDMLSCR